MDNNPVEIELEFDMELLEKMETLAQKQGISLDELICTIIKKALLT